VPAQSIYFEALGLLDTEKAANMPGTGYASRKKAILAAEEAMRVRFGLDIRFEPVPRSHPWPRTFQVLDDTGREVAGFRIYKVGAAIQEWAWQEITAQSPSTNGLSALAFGVRRLYGGVPLRKQELITALSRGPRAE
jgi:hypothetical protein